MVFKNEPNTVFVYGTLKRGQCRSNRWPATPLQVAAAWCLGTLYGRDDYPAMTFGTDRVLGEAWTFAAHEMQMVLKTLDQIEGTNHPHALDLYQRVLLDAHFVDPAPQSPVTVRAYTFHYATDPRLDDFVAVTPNASNRFVWW